METKIKKETFKCKRCNIDFNNSSSPVSLKIMLNNIEKYTTKCKECRKYKDCEFCNNEFDHYQNRTCSKDCAQKLKERTLLESCGATHNLASNSLARLKMKNKLLSKYGVTNVWQRKDVINKIKRTCEDKYGKGITNPSQAKEIKDKKRKTAIENGNWIDYEKFPKSDMQLYYDRVWEVTNYEFSNFGLLVLGNDCYLKIKSGKFQRDHMYSISKGFENNIQPEIIGSIYNIELLTNFENNSKGKKCSILIKELQHKIKKDENKIYSKN